MPLLDITISQPCSCFCNNISAFRSAHFQSRIAVGNDRGLGLASAFSWKSLCIKQKVVKNFSLERVEVRRSRLKIKAVATFEISSVTGKSNNVNGQQNMLSMDFDLAKSNSLALESQFSSEDSIEAKDREKLRRMRISKANKGNTPWNKGRKHSPETLQRIKERTRLAMQDPKVRMKLVNLGHAQSEETRIKIGVGVRLGWERRRERLMLQESCHYEWLNLIAEAARKGLLGEKELQWNSYKILDKQLEKEWLQSVEQRKNMPRPKGSKRAPKSTEQKRKISEAISAKWADPDYRTRVCSALAKYHGNTEGVERKPRKKPNVDGQRSLTKKKIKSDIPAKPEVKTQVQPIKLRKSKAPSYKDPLANTKLEMLKSIRAQRVASVDQKTEAINRAKLLISEAEKAAKALEKAAQNSPLAQAFLLESRMLIAEAIQFLESVESEEDPAPYENDSDLSESSPESMSHAIQEEKVSADTNSFDVVNHKEVNGFHCLSPSDFDSQKSRFNKSLLTPLVNGHVVNSCNDDYFLEIERGEETKMSSHDFLSIELNNAEKCSNLGMSLSSSVLKPNGSKDNLLLNSMEFQSENAEAAPKQVNTIKKWVRGRLVEVTEEA